MKQLLCSHLTSPVIRFAILPTKITCIDLKVIKFKSNVTHTFTYSVMHAEACIGCAISPLDLDITDISLYL